MVLTLSLPAAFTLTHVMLSSTLTSYVAIIQAVFVGVEAKHVPHGSHLKKYLTYLVASYEGFPASSCSVLHQRSFMHIHYDTILMKRDTGRLLHKSFPPHFGMLGVTLQFASCSSLNSLHLCGDAGRQKAREGSRIVIMSSSWEDDNYLIRRDNCADSLTVIILHIWDSKEALKPG